MLCPIMDIFNEDGESTGRGYNSWRYGEFVQRKDSNNTQFHAALHNMNIKTGTNIQKILLKETLERTW